MASSTSAPKTAVTGTARGKKTFHQVAAEKAEYGQRILMTLCNKELWASEVLLTDPEGDDAKGLIECKTCFIARYNRERASMARQWCEDRKPETVSGNAENFPAALSEVMRILEQKTKAGCFIVSVDIHLADSRHNFAPWFNSYQGSPSAFFQMSTGEQVPADKLNRYFEYSIVFLTKKALGLWMQGDDHWDPGTALLPERAVS